MKAGVAVLGILSFLTLHRDASTKSIRAGCSIKVNGDLPEPQPLLLIPGGSKDGLGFYLPEDNNGIVSVNAGEDVLLACPGDTNYLNFTGSGTKTVLATCNSGTSFTVGSKSYRFSDFACKSYPFHVAKKTGETCYDGSKSQIEIGFEVESDFYKLIDVCFDDELYVTLYSHFTLVSGIGGYQSGFPRPSFIQDSFYPGLSVNTLYTRNTQRQTISSLLGSTQLGSQYISDSSDYFLARGHLTAKASFVYGSEQRGTFHFVNVCPQWQTFNGGNWNSLEMSVRTYADKKKLTLQVFTGSYGVATLPNNEGEDTELYLYVDENNNNGLPVPKFYWKVAYDPISEAGIAFVGINNPYVSDPTEDYLICEDVCSEISWLQWDQKNIKKGYSYCCDVNEFRSVVDTLPDFTVTSLLK